MSADAFDNAVRALAAIAGATNAVVHLLALAGRMDVELTLSRVAELWRTTPQLVNVKPGGRFLMQDFYQAGGMPAVLNELGPLLHSEALTVTGRVVRANLADVTVRKGEVIGSLERPVKAGSPLVVLTGNLAPLGAILKQAAASDGLLTHRGQAVVFDNYVDFVSRVDEPSLQVRSDSVLVIRNSGPKGAAKMGVDDLGITLPKKLLREGVRDMVRLTDGRISGTAFGTVVVHSSPESAVGGPLALVRNGDWIVLDVPRGSIRLDIPDAEFARRTAEWKPDNTGPGRGYGRLYFDHVLPINEGCDFDFLKGREPV
jgi:dihydroxyacid dehydratase/phosphogluconate dehydratase